MRCVRKSLAKGRSGQRSGGERGNEWSSLVGGALFPRASAPSGFGGCGVRREEHPPLGRLQPGLSPQGHVA